MKTSGRSGEVAECERFFSTHYANSEINLYLCIGLSLFLFVFAYEVTLQDATNKTVHAELTAIRLSESFA